MKFRINTSILLFAISILLPLLGTLEAGQSTPQEGEFWTIGQLLDKALENNPETKAAWWNAQRAASALGSSESAYYPQLDLNLNMQHGRQFQYTNGPDVNYTTVQAAVIMTFLLADFGERAAAVEAAALALGAAGWQSDWSIQKVMAQVFENSYLTIAAQDALEALEASLNDASKMLDAATKLNQAGLSPISDVYSSQAALAQIQIEVVQQRSLLQITRAKLAATLGLEAGTSLKLLPIDALAVPKQSLKALIEIAKSKRQDLMAQRLRLSEAIARQSKAAAQYKPKLSLNARGGAEHAASDKANGSHYRIALNFDIPLFTGFNAMYQNRLALADVKISEQELLRLELEIALEVFSESCRVDATQEMLKFAQINLESAQKAYQATLEKYSAGHEGIAEVSNALRQIVLARVRYSEINSRHLIALANLAYATGTLSHLSENLCASK